MPDRTEIPLPPPVEGAPRPPDRRGLGFLVRALGHRNYRLFFMGQAVSLVGTWMTRVATGWLVYRLTSSPFWLGVVSFASLAPIFLAAPFAGVLVDRVNRHRLLVVTQLLAMGQSLGLAALALSGHITVGHVVALNLGQGFINAVDMPLRQAFLVEMVEDRQDLSNAIALNSTLFNGARLVGPSIAGLLIALAGEGICFLVDGISYLGVVAALLAMTVRPRAVTRSRGNLWQGISEGTRYAFGFGPIRAILLLLVLISLEGFPYLVFLPVFARDILHGGPYTLGFLMAATGVGALGGGIFLASRRTVVGLERVLVAAVIVFSVGVILFSLSRSLWLSVPMLLFSGFGMMVQMASCNTLVQTLVDDDKRGRVMSLYSMCSMGIAPFGSLLAGTVAHHVGAPTSNVIGASLCLVGALVFLRSLPWFRRLAAPVYTRQGILPEVAAGLSSATRLGSYSGD